MKRFKLFLVLAIIIVLGLLIYFPGGKWARAHVNSKTAVDDHPLLCTSCHLSTQTEGFLYKMINEDYYSPFNIAVSNDGARLYVVAQDADELMVIDAEKNEVLNHIKVGIHPHSIVLSNNGKFGYVSNQWSDNVSVINLDILTVTDTLKTGNGPSGLSLSNDGKFLYAVNTFSSDLSVIDLSTNEEIKRLPVGKDPTGIALSPNGEKLYVTSRRGNIVPYGEPLVSDVAEVSTHNQRVSRILGIEAAYMMENITFTPKGDLALMALIRPKNLIPTVQVEGGWMMNHGIGIIEQTGEGRVIQLLLDEPNAYYSDPFDIAITPDGKKAFVSSAGVDCISVIAIDSLRAIISESSDEVLALSSNNLGISSRYVIKRIPTGNNPKGIALSPDGTKLYVAEHLNDKIGVINTENLELLESIDLEGPKRISVARKGKRIFSNAGGTFQNQYACYTCHPDSHEDGLVYNMASKDMGRNVTNTQSLREIKGTEPFKWNGKNQTVYKQDGMRFSTVLTRTEQFSYPDLDALVAYILTGIKYPPNLMNNPNGELTDAQLRGKEIFERSVDNFGNPIEENNRCITCHPPPNYSNFEMVDVSTLAETDDSMLFDTPHLNDIYASAPYLHDGRAETLEEIWTIYGTDDKHGYVNDMTKMQLNDLVAYLKSLRGAGYDKRDLNIQQASF